MARMGDDLHAGGPAAEAGQKTSLSAHSGAPLTVPDDFISHADILRDGQDLVLKTADGHTVVIQGYFSADPHPSIHSPSGALLSAEMIQSFVHHAGPVELADSAAANDASPVGVAREVHGHAMIRHTDGTSETIAVGAAIHEGDVIETDGSGAVNITFRDNSSFAVSQNAKLAIDEYVFDPHSDAGASNFSMLRGVFVYTSGLIGHADPDDVHIHTPAGSIGIRGTVIAGNIDTGTITVVEGAIVLQSNTGEETTLSSQYQTAQLDTQTGHITQQGNMTASDVAAKFSSVSNVAPAFFSGLAPGAPDAAHPDGNNGGHEAAPGTAPAHGDAPATGAAPAGSHGADAAPGNTTTVPAADTAAPGTAGFSGEGAAFGASGDSFAASSTTASTPAPAVNTISASPASAAGTAPVASAPASAAAPIVGATAPPVAAPATPAAAVTLDASGVSATMNEGSTLSLGSIAGHDTDTSATLTYSVSGITHGTISGALTGLTLSQLQNLTYTNDGATVNGTQAGFTVTVDDGQGRTASQNVLVTIHDVPPSLNTSGVATAINEGGTVSLASITAADSDIGSQITYSVSNITHGTMSSGTLTGLTLSQLEALTYTNDGATPNGTAGGFTVTADDGLGLAVHTDLAFTVNDPGPTLGANPAVTVSEGANTAMTGHLSATESGVAPAGLTYTVTAAVNSAFGELYYSTDGGTTILRNLTAGQTFTQADIANGDIYLKSLAQTATSGYASEGGFSFSVADANGGQAAGTLNFVTGLTINDNGSTIAGGNHGDSFTLSGTGSANNTINAGTGDDTFTIAGTAHGNSIHGGDGNDTFTLSATGAGNSVTGDAGNNIFTIGGSGFSVYGDNSTNTDAGVNTFTISGGGNTVYAGNNGDTFSVTGSGGSANLLTGGAGNDTFNITAPNVNLNTGAGTNTVTLSSAVTGNVVLTGGSGADTLTLGAGWHGAIDDGAGITATGFETINTSASGAGAAINIVVDDGSALTAASIGHTISINLQSSLDQISLNFGSNALGFHQVVVNANETDFVSLGGTDTIAVHYVTGATVGAAIPLDLGSLLTGPSAQGYSITDNNDEGFGSSIASLGDVDGDGLSDLALVKNANQTSGGLFFEDESLTMGLANTTAASLPSHSAGFITNIGNATDMHVANIGDFGSGTGHYFAISAPQADMLSGFITGDVNIFDAANPGVIAETLTGITGPSGFGASIAGVGDIAGNGYDDLLVGAPGNPPSTGSPGADGAVYLLYGDNLNSSVDVTAMPGNMGTVITGAAGENFGANVGGAGDFNNDGHSDFLVSAPGDGAAMDGKVYIYEGGNLGSPVTIDMDAFTPLNAGGSNPGTSSMGIPLADLGDVNGGGVTDIAVLSYADNKVYGFFGGSSLPATLNAHTDAGFTIAPASGQILSMGAVGDFNGDGYNDLGVVVKTGNTADIYIVYGGATLQGTLTAADLNNPHDAFHMTLDMTSVHANPVTGNYDITIGSAGDVNGDGLGDVAIGIPGLDTNGGTASADGAALVVYGQDSGDNSLIVTDNSALDLSGTAHVIVAGAANESLIGSSGADTLNNNGLSGISYSAGAGDDTINLDSSPFQTIDGGSGTDTINFLSASGTLNFTALGSESVAHIEQIDMSSTSQTLILSTANIFNLMETSDNGNLLISTSGSTGTNSLSFHTGGSAQTGLTASQLDAALGTTSANTVNGADTEFHFGSHTLSIDTHLLASAHVNIV